LTVEEAEDHIMNYHVLLT